MKVNLRIKAAPPVTCRRPLKWIRGFAQKGFEAFRLAHYELRIGCFHRFAPGILG